MRDGTLDTLTIIGVLGILVAGLDAMGRDASLILGGFGVVLLVALYFVEA